MPYLLGYVRESVRACVLDRDAKKLPACSQARSLNRISLARTLVTGSSRTVLVRFEIDRGEDEQLCRPRGATRGEERHRCTTTTTTVTVTTTPTITTMTAFSSFSFSLCIVDLWLTPLL